MIDFIVPGQPVAQGRPRATTVNGNARLYDPEKSREYKKLVKFHANLVAPKELLEGPLLVILNFYMQTPKSYSKKNKAAGERKEFRPVTKPDVDNLAKSIKDACNKRIWKDDSQVVSLIVHKWYSENDPRVEVFIDQIS